MSTRRTLSPRDLARAIGASESSLKRWVDDGLIGVHRTAGGHRRIPIAEALRFIRDSGHTLLDPTALGIFPRPGPSLLESSPARLEDQLLNHFLDGDAQRAHSLLVWMFATGTPLCDLFDGPLAFVMARIGEIWRVDPRGIFIGLRATEICLHGLYHLRGLLPVAEAPAKAVGASIARDPYSIPTLMASLVLQSEGLGTVNLGPNCPAVSLRHAIEQTDARLAWVSVSSSEIEAAHVDKELAVVLDSCRQRGVRMVLGGRRHDLLAGRQRKDVFVCASMRELAGFARGLSVSAASSAG